MKILIAGLGSIGRRHLRNLLALGERDIMLFRTEHRTLPDDELAGFPVETDLEAALAHRPGGSHRFQSHRAAPGSCHSGSEAGCHILLEKPISHRWTESLNLQAAMSDSGGAGTWSATNSAFHPGLQQVKSCWQKVQLVDRSRSRPLG